MTGMFYTNSGEKKKLRESQYKVVLGPHFYKTISLLVIILISGEVFFLFFF